MKFVVDKRRASYFTAQLFLASVVILVTLLIASCGGGGGGLPQERPGGNITGVAFDGRILNANVSAYDFTQGAKGELLASGHTDELGIYQLNITSPNRPVLIEVTGGRYIEEASGVLINLQPGQTLKALSHYTSGKPLTVSVTYFTHLATGLAEFFISTGQNTVAAINNANALMSSLIGIDITNTYPRDITDPVTEKVELDDSYRYGFATASISQWTAWVSEQNKQPPHSLYNSIFFAQRAYDDIKTDGLLNGQGESGLISIGSIALSPEIYRNDIALNILVMANSARNVTGLSAADLVSLSDSYSASPAQFDIYADAPTTPLDRVPVIGNLSHADNDMVAGTINFSATVTDTIGIERVALEIDNTSLGNASDTANPTIEIDTSLYSDGPHTIKLTATNAIGNASSLETILFVSNTATYIGNIKPKNGAFVRGNFNMSADVGDPIGIASVSFAIDDTLTLVPEAFDKPVVEINTSDIEDGPHSFTITATNTVENSIKQSVDYVVDNTPPRVSFETLASGDYLKGDITVQGTAEDANGIILTELYFDGALHTAFDDPKNIKATINTTQENGEGAKSIALAATDSAGNISKQLIDVTIDNTPPVVTLNPLSDLVAGPFNVTGSATDKVGIAGVKLLVDDELSESISNFDSIDVSVDSKKLSDGKKKVSLEATDLAGNQHIASLETIIDNTKPTASLNVNELAIFSGKVTVNGSATDANGIAETELSFNNQVIKKSSDGNATDVSINTQDVADGTVAISLTAVDNAGNSGTTSKQVIVDNSAPTLTISAPAEGQHIRGETKVKGSISDANGISQAELFLEAAKQAVTDFDKIDLAVNTKSVDDGARQIKLSATDKAGINKSLLRNVIVDNTKPTVSFDELGQYVSGVIKVSGEADDNIGLQDAKLLANNNLVSTFDKPSKPSASINTLDFPDGKNTFTITATDKAGNSQSASRETIVDNTPPTVVVTKPAPNSFFNANFDVTANIADSVGLKSARVTFGDVSYTRDQPESPLRQTVDVSELKDGPYTVTVLAEDTMGHTSSAIASNVTIDRAPPLLNINDYQSHGSNVCRLTVTSSDAGSGIASVSVNGQDNEATSGTWTTDIQVALFSQVTVEFIATDLAGNKASFPQCVLHTLRPGLALTTTCRPC